MTLQQLAKKLRIPKKQLEESASQMVLLAEFRRIEAELLTITSKYGVRSVDDMDRKIASGKLSEEDAGEDFFKLDFLMEQKGEIEQLLKKFQEKPQPWADMRRFGGLLKLNFGR